MAKTIVTHDGAFHADEVMAISIIKALYREVNIVRTRDTALIAATNPDFLIDIGNEYNFAEGKFDHHQIDDSLVRKDGTPYSSVGLIWKHYGRNLLTYYGVKNDLLEDVFNTLDHELIKAIDLIDTGHRLPNFSIPEVHFSLIINRLNSRDVYNQKNQDIAFQKALDMSVQILESFIYSAHDFILSERQFHKLAMSGKSVIELPFSINVRRLAKRYRNLKCVFFARGDGNWNIVIAQEKYNFGTEIAGKSPEEINDYFQIDDAVFIHKAGFVAVTKTRASAIKIAEYVDKVNA